MSNEQTRPRVDGSYIMFFGCHVRLSTSLEGVISLILPDMRRASNAAPQIGNLADTPSN